MIAAFGERAPLVDPSAIVFEGATVVGRVILGAESSIWFGAIVRGDVDDVNIGARTNVQDRAVIHVTTKKFSTVIGDEVTIGHGAILHGCRIGAGALVGMNAVVMDDAVIGESSIVGAMSFVKAGTVVPPRMLIAGIPARVLRELTEQEIAWKTNGTVTYHDIAARSLATMTATEALTAVEPDRPRVKGRASTPLHKLKG